MIGAVMHSQTLNKTSRKTGKGVNIPQQSIIKLQLGF